MLFDGCAICTMAAARYFSKRKENGDSLIKSILSLSKEVKGMEDLLTEIQKLRGLEEIKYHYNSNRKFKEHYRSKGVSDNFFVGNVVHDDNKDKIKTPYSVSFITNNDGSIKLYGYSLRAYDKNSIVKSKFFADPIKMDRTYLKRILKDPKIHKPEYNDKIVNSLIDILKSNDKVFKRGIMIDFGHSIYSNKVFREEINKYLGENTEIAKSLNSELIRCKQELGLKRVYESLTSIIPNLWEKQQRRTGSLPSKIFPNLY